MAASDRARTSRRLAQINAALRQLAKDTLLEGELDPAAELQFEDLSQLGASPDQVAESQEWVDAMRRSELWWVELPEEFDERAAGSFACRVHAYRDGQEVFVRAVLRHRGGRWTLEVQAELPDSRLVSVAVVDIALSPPQGSKPLEPEELDLVTVGRQATRPEGIDGADVVGENSGNWLHPNEDCRLAVDQRRATLSIARRIHPVEACLAATEPAGPNASDEARAVWPVIFAADAEDDHWLTGDLMLPADLDPRDLRLRSVSRMTPKEVAELPSPLVSRLVALACRAQCPPVPENPWLVELPKAGALPWRKDRQLFLRVARPAERGS